MRGLPSMLMPAALVAMGSLLSPIAAGASRASTITWVSLERDFTNRADNVVRPLPGLVFTIPVGTGLEPVFLYGQISARSTSRANILQSARISCRGPSGTVRYMRADRNHEGFDAYAGAPLKVPVRFLYAPTAAGDHRCSLGFHSYSSAGSQLALVALHGPDTYLGYASPQPRAISFSTENDRYDVDFGVPCPDHAACQAATHLGVNHSGVLLPAGTFESVNRSPMFHASSSAHSLDLINDLYVTVCYANTTTCPAYAEGRPAIRGVGSTVEVRQVVLQLDVHGRICATQATAYRRYHVTSGAHHRKLYLRTSAYGFAAACGTSRRIRTRADVRWISGNPLRIDQERYKTTGIIMER